MSGEAKGLAEQLVRQHGLEEAKALALREVVDTEKSRDYYRLSVWREVRTILEKLDAPKPAGTSG